MSLYNQYQQFNEEQASIKKYVAQRATQRPKTTVWHICLIVIVYGLSCGLLSLIALYIDEQMLWKVTLILFIWMVPFLIFARSFFIKLIECYQHYAKVSTRTKCLCKPTCSEYSIAVLRKYPLIIALLKIRKRLFKTCKDGIYKIDLP